MGEIIKGRRFFINNTENCLEFSAQSISFALFLGRNLYRWIRVKILCLNDKKSLVRDRI